jgi:phosphoglycolate phosphatase-like HAD superfamily hydrolase
MPDPTLLTSLVPRFDSFVGVDSDGCVFDTMGVKQREHFHPLILRHWGIEALEKPFRQAAEFVNLGSTWRGQNRFPNLLKAFELLADMPGVRDSGVALPKLDALRAYCNSGLPLGNPSLKAEVARTGDPELRRLLDWSLAINRDIDERMRPVAPFAWALRSLHLIVRSSDVIVVSQTPEEALVKEWRLHGLEPLVRVIAGQELGTKTEHLRLAAGRKYAPGRILMIGDAPGDAHAARAAEALFYPILPDHEEAAWQRFHDEAYARFLAGTYAGAYEDALVAAFDASLPDTPPWFR